MTTKPDSSTPQSMEPDTETSDPARNTRHAAQVAADPEERWSAMRTGSPNNSDALDAILLDVIGEAPAYQDEYHLDPQDDHRLEILQDYLEQIPVMQRIVLVHHYGIWGDKIDPQKTAEDLSISRAQYDEHLLSAKASLATRKNELFKELSLDALKD